MSLRIRVASWSAKLWLTSLLNILATELFRTKKVYLYICRLGKKHLAGSTSRVGNPLFNDFLLVGWKLDKLGFIYNRGNVLILESQEYQNAA